MGLWTYVLQHHLHALIRGKSFGAETGWTLASFNQALDSRRRPFCSEATSRNDGSGSRASAASAAANAQNSKPLQESFAAKARVCLSTEGVEPGLSSIGAYRNRIPALQGLLDPPPKNTQKGERPRQAAGICDGHPLGRLKLQQFEDEVNASWPGGQCRLTETRAGKRETGTFPDTIPPLHRN